MPQVFCVCHTWKTWTYIQHFIKNGKGWQGFDPESNYICSWHLLSVSFFKKLKLLYSMKRKRERKKKHKPLRKNISNLKFSHSVPGDNLNYLIQAKAVGLKTAFPFSQKLRKMIGKKQLKNTFHSLSSSFSRDSLQYNFQNC